MTLGWTELALWVGPFAMLFVGMVRGPTAADRMTTDEEMIDAVRGGDATAYRGLVERYQSRVYHLIYGMVRNQEDARDLTQDTFVKAYRSLHTFREDSRFYTWVYRIAMNIAIDFARRKAKAPLPGLDEDVAARDGDGGIAEVHHADSPRKALERKQMYGAILDALEQLPAEQKQVILLRELEGLSYKEIAEVMGIAEGTVMSRLFYARKKLQQMLGEHRQPSRSIE